jgi:hypothetical protein
MPIATTVAEWEDELATPRPGGATLAAERGTRVSARISDPSGFKLLIYPQGAFDPIGKWMGLQDIIVGHPAFDAAFIVQGNDEARVKALFADAALCDALVALPRATLRTVLAVFPEAWPAGERVIQLDVDALLADPAPAVRALELTVARLIAIGAAVPR